MLSHRPSTLTRAKIACIPVLQAVCFTHRVPAWRVAPVAPVCGHCGRCRGLESGELSFLRLSTIDR